MASKVSTTASRSRRVRTICQRNPSSAQSCAPAPVAPVAPTVTGTPVARSVLTR